ncbi:alpha-L-fucosidase [Draconibacterium sp.]|nr:alpha-L-fucosidase [Draconibacterium sp.]
MQKLIELIILKINTLSTSKLIKYKFLFLFVFSFCIPSVLFAQESEEVYHSRMKWWDDGRLGMFLHWGVYSTYGGEYGGEDHGKEMGHASAEWIFLKANIPQKEYQKAALNFNPTKYNAKEWVKIARDAGMKYMVLTSKHHDGFALFDTKASDWNAVKASGIKKDLIKEYVDACHEAGMRVGFYYSHEKDWTHHAKVTKDATPLADEYKSFVKTQIKELFTNYGTIDLIWFDTPVAEHKEFNRECAMLVRKLQPNCIINGRIGNNLGDYKNIGDRAIVDPGLAGYMESIMTMRINWGFDKNDDYWKSSEDLIRMVSRSACRGSNFLLNIGPKPDGTFPIEDRVRLHDLGKWMNKNGEAIYKTKGSPFMKEHKWGSVTTSKNNNTVYLHLWNWSGGEIELHGLLSDISKAAFLDSGEKVHVEKLSKGKTKIFLPEKNIGEATRIVKLEIAGPVKFDLSAGPDFEGEKVEYVTTRLIKGKVTELDGTSFTIMGKRSDSTKEGYEVYSDVEKTFSFSLNDHVRFRTNDNGDIRSVQSLEIQKGKTYRVVYSPYEEGWVVEIITEMR